MQEAKIKDKKKLYPTRGRTSFSQRKWLIAVQRQFPLLYSDVLLSPKGPFCALKWPVSAILRSTIILYSHSCLTIRRQLQNRHELRRYTVMYLEWIHAILTESPHCTAEDEPLPKYLLKYFYEKIYKIPRRLSKSIIIPKDAHLTTTKPPYNYTNSPHTLHPYNRS